MRKCLITIMLLFFFVGLQPASAQTPASEPAKSSSNSAPAPVPPAQETAATPANPPAPSPPASPAPVQALPINEAAGIMGRPVRGVDGKDLGRIIDAIVDQNGQPRAAVIDFGGFLGIGNRKIAVDWSTLHFTPGNQTAPVTLDLTPEQIKAAPEYREAGRTPAAVVTPPSTPSPSSPPASPPPASPSPASPPEVKPNEGANP